MLPLRVLKKQLHINIKLVKNRNITVIGIIICLSLTEKHDRGILDINIWRQSDLSTLIKKNCEFEFKIVTDAAKFVFVFVKFVKYNEFL